MKTNVYIDGFNLYYGCLKKTPYRWLNVAELCRLMLPKDTIHRIKYFTARVSARPRDPIRVHTERGPLAAYRNRVINRLNPANTTRRDCSGGKSRLP